MQLYSWGANSYGQLGTGNTEDHFLPISCGYFEEDLKGLTGGGGHSLVWAKNYFFAVGLNSHGQLGNMIDIIPRSWSHK